MPKHITTNLFKDVSKLINDVKTKPADGMLKTSLMAARDIYS